MAVPPVARSPLLLYCRNSVVSSLLGRHAEFEVCVKGGGRSWSKWQRFSKFKMIAACVQDDRSAMKAWKRVLRAQPHYRCLHPAYLAQKCNLLEVVNILLIL